MPAANTSAALIDHFADLQDPRVERSRRHDLLDILALTVCAVLSNCDSYEDIELYGREKYDWLKTFLRLPNGIPSHDTINRVLTRLDPAELRDCLVNWTCALAETATGRVIPIDGKTLRGSLDRAAGTTGLHLVSAWAAEVSLTLGQVATDAKSNAITAIPKLLDLLDLEGAIVTLDALGCQKDIAGKIRAGGADYVLQLKANHEALHQAAQEAFADRFEAGDGDATAVPLSVWSSGPEAGHGRTEARTVYAMAVPDDLAGKDAWRDLRTLVMVFRERSVGGETSEAFSYYLTSLPADAEALGRAIRLHWTIENTLHWVLDVTFGEDASRVRSGHGAENLGLVRRLALSLLKQDDSKGSLKAKRLRAGWNNDFLLKILLVSRGIQHA
jgi:predicted transposase YbfD/YdcC